MWYVDEMKNVVKIHIPKKFGMGTTAKEVDSEVVEWVTRGMLSLF